MPHYEKILFEVPDNWVWCKLEDIVSFGGGKTPSMDNKEYWHNGNHLWVTSKDMKYSHITDSLMKITDKALELMTIYERGTLLVVTRSGILRHTLPISILESPATVNQDLKAISPYLQELSEYLYIVIKANEHFILKEYHKDGTTVDSIDFDKFNIAHEDTLISPQHWDEEPFEVIVSNPPYSIKWEGDDNPVLINDPRFSPAGVLAPKSKADLAFIMHSLAWLATNGTAAIVCFPGIMYRGGAEKKIRQYLIDNNFIDCIIQLPGNLFFGTSIATCIMVLKKSKAENKTLFIDASKEFVKVTNNNKLTEDNIAKIVASFVDREDKDYFCRLVPNDEIAAQDYNLSVSTYVEQEDTREVINITELNAEIKRIVAREQVLRDEIDKIIAEIEVE